MRVCQRQRRLLWESLRESLSVTPFYRAFFKSPNSRMLCHSWATCSSSRDASSWPWPWTPWLWHKPQDQHYGQWRVIVWYTELLRCFNVLTSVKSWYCELGYNLERTIKCINSLNSKVSTSFLVSDTQCLRRRVWFAHFLSLS